MKLKSVEYNQHPILSNLCLDFCEPATGQPYDNIVIAGQNGTGKTTIFKTLNTFLCGGSMKPFKEIGYLADGKEYKAFHRENDQDQPDYDRVNLTDNSTRRINRSWQLFKNAILSDLADPRAYGCVLSRARADFKSQKITHTSSQDIDVAIHNGDDNDDFTSLKQLLVDISSQDNEEYARINSEREGSNQPPLQYSAFEVINSKIYRFKNAFNNFFEKIKFIGVLSHANQKDIGFTKEGKHILIDDLSTGEKQIVYRGAHLLRNLTKLRGATIFVDEPELSMHPLWQGKILQYYTGLFKDNNNNQIAQMFFATHSERVITEALKNPNTLVIVLTEENGSVQAKRIVTPGVLPTITAAETNYLAFNVYSTDYHIQLYGWLQERENQSTIKACDQYIKGRQDVYDSTVHDKPSDYGNTHYETLPTYVRNAIHHPQLNPNPAFSDEDLRVSTELLRSILL